MTGLPAHSGLRAGLPRPAGEAAPAAWWPAAGPWSIHSRATADIP